MLLKASTAIRKPVDIYIVYLASEWMIASTVARFLHECGYRVEPAAKFNLPSSGAEPVPADAYAVLVIWPIRSELFPKPALEARAAEQRGHLLQIYAGHERPQESYRGASPVDFAKWNYLTASPQWRALVGRVKALCGPPPKDVSAPTGVFVAFLVASLGAALFALSRGEDSRPSASTEPEPTPAMEPSRLADRNAQPVRLQDAVRAAEPTADGLGGPEEYNDDLRETAVESVPPPPPPRPKQGPDP